MSKEGIETIKVLYELKGMVKSNFEDTKGELLEIKDHSGYPDNFTFKAINTYKLKEYLITKNSKLLEENYINTVLNIAADFDINPLLLFSIIGQEQSYIPIDNEFADSHDH